jgi:putative DNA primase/helicase
MNAEQLAEALGARRSGRQWKCRCIAHEDSSPSMIIFDGRQSVQLRCLAGCEPVEIIGVLRARGLWSGADAQDASTVKPFNAPHETSRREREAMRLRELARGIFDGAVPIEGTLAERYFDGRDLLSVARTIGDIRYQPRCPREDVRQPAVVIAMRHITSNAVVAVQRIFLTRDAKKDGKPMMLGTAGGAAMKLQPVLGHELNVAEGLETGLSLVAMDRKPVWALGSTSLIQSFPVLQKVNKLVIWADHDEVNVRTGKRPGIAAAEACRERWRAADREVKVQVPDVERDDANDVWRSRLGR